MPTNLLVLLSPQNMILFIVVFTRLGGLMTSAPLFSTYPIPGQVKAWLVATISLIIFPMVLAKGGFAMPTSMPELTVILLKEFSIGYIIGFVSNVLFIAVEMAANLISMQMALSAAQALNPLSGDSSAILSQFYTLLASMVFIGLNGYQWLFSAVYKSFQTVPPGYGFIINGTITHEVLFITGQMFTIALGIALPMFAVLFITDVLLGFASKMMPQMNIFMVSMPLKIYLGLMLGIMFIQPISEHLAVLMEKILIQVVSIF